MSKSHVIEVPKLKVAILAVAANEGPYIAHFLFHHLRMGFGPIYVATNNCVDKTVEIVDKISRHHSEVRRVDADYLYQLKKDEKIGAHQKNTFQTEAYQECLKLAAGSLGPADYVMPLDIDEFWIPLDGSRTIQDHLHSLNYPDMVGANWVIPVDDSAPFTRPVGATMDVWCWPILKSTWRYSYERIRITPHTVIPRTMGREVRVSGLGVEEHNRNRTTSSPENPGSAAIIHRMNRSVTEYLAALRRGNPDDNFPLKTNRNGYQKAEKFAKRYSFPLPRSFVDDWQQDYDRFITDLGLLDDIRSSMEMVLDRAKDSIVAFNSLSQEDQVRYAHLLDGVDMERVNAEIHDILQSLRAT